MPVSTMKREGKNRSTLRLSWLMSGIFSAAIIFVSVLSHPTYAASRQSTLNLSISTDTLSLDILPTPDGAFNSSDNATISVKTNNFTGYTLSILGDEDGCLVSDEGHSMDSITSAVSETNFRTSSAYNNKWGYKPSQYITSNNGVNTTVTNTNNYLPSPNGTTGDIIDITNAANAQNNTYTLAIGARANTELAPGTYENTFTIVAISNAIVYNVYYNANTTDTVNNMPLPNPQGSEIPGGTATASSYVTLNSAVPTRTGFTFSGWCNKATTNDATTGNQTCSGNTFAAGSNYGIDQTIDNTDIELYAIWHTNQYNITITPSTGISSIVVKQNNTTICTITNSNTCSLYHGVAYDITATPATGYNFNNWSDSKDSSAIGNANLATTTYTPSDPTSVLTASATAKTYTITLNKNGATNTPTTSVTATYNNTTLSNISTLPTRSYTISGFTIPSGNNANGATVSSSSTLTSTYTFNGWYKESGATNKIAGNTATPALQANTTYTDANSKWINDGAVTLYAGWTAQAKTLPTITKEGYTCGWTTTSTGATTITYASGGSITPSANTTLYGVCVIKSDLSLKVSFNSTYVSSIAVKTGSASGTTVGTVSTSGNSVTGLTYGTAYYLVPTYTTGSVLNSWAKDSGAVGTLSSTSAANPTYTIGDGTNAVTHNGKRATYTVTLNRNCATTATGSTSATATYYSTTLSAITVPTCSDKTDTYTVSGFTKATSATNSTVSSTTTLNSNRITTYAFNGWHDTSGTGTLVASTAATPALQASVSGYTDSSKRWTRTSAATLYAGWDTTVGNYSAVTLPTITRTGSTCGWSTSSTATTIQYASGASITPTANTTLYGVCVTNISLNANGGTGGSTSTTVNYNATTLGTITNPTRANTTGTRTVSGFTKTTSATNSTVSSTTTLNSTNTTTYTFNGWYKESGATNKIASNATTPALQASTTYTDANSKWTYTTAGAITLYAGWTASAGAYSAVTLPTITRTGSTCGWSTSSTGTTISYNSGASFTPTANTTLYGVCINNITLNNAGATTAGSTSTTVNYNATALNTITLPQRKYTVSGFTKTTSATNSTVSSTSTITATSTLNGWYTASSGGTKIAAGGTDTTPDLQASTTYTNSSKQWTYTTAGAITLYSQWTNGSVTLPTITRTGSTCGWSTSSTATTITHASGASITPTANTTLYGVCVTNISLNANGGTGGSTSTTVNYNATTLGTITNPTRANSTGTRTVSGFTLNTSATGATVSSTTTLNSTNTTTYTFNGWYKESGATNKIASNATTPALQASTTYTDANSKWTYTTAGAITLYAGWTANAGAYSAVTLPTITKAGHTCGWGTSNTATTITYASGASMTPTANTTLYGVCIAIGYTVTLRAGNGISALTLSGWTGTGTGTLTKTYHIGDTIDLSTVTPTYKTGYNGAKYIKNDSIGSISGSTYTVGAGNGDITISASSLNAPVCTMQGGATKVFNQSATTLTATSNASSYDTNVNITYSFGFANSATNTLGNFSTAQAGNTFTLNAGSFRGTKYYGVTVVVTDPNDNTITNTCTSGTGSNTGTTVANRTTMSLVNSRIDFSAGTGGTLSGTSPVYVAYNGTNSYSTRTGTTARAIPTATKTGYTFNGWYTAATGGSQVVDASGNRKASVSSWTNASSQWVRTTTNDNATNNTLYAQYTAKTYTVTLDRNCSTTATGSTSTTATYDATTLAAITVPTCSNSTSTRTISGWTVPSGNNADGATVNGGTAPGTLNSTSTTTYTFNGWHATSGTGTLVASTAATPALQASTDYTDANKKWTYDDNATLYAGWTANAGAYNSVTLPTITKTGYTCGWTTTSTGATTIQYASGGSITPSANTTLYGVCVIKNNLSLKVSFNSTYVSSIKVCKTSGNCSGTNLMGTVSTSGNSVSGLTYGVAYYLYPTYTTGSVLNSWAKDSGAVGTLSSTSAANPTYTIGDGTNAVTHNGKRATYTVTLNQCSATTNGSTSATATYYSTTLSSITNPQRAYTVSGFTKTTSASGATVSSTTTLTSTYTFGGWVDGSCSGSTLVASNATTPTLQASVSGYTDSSKRWTRTSATTLYAKWTAQAKTLPTISWAGYTCRWQDANNTSTYYNSGASVTPTANLTLQGVCEAIDYTVTLRTGSGLSAIAPSGWTNAGNGTFTKVFHVGDTIDLSTVSTTLKTNYTGTKYTINNGIGSLSGSTYTVGAGNGDITISAASIDPIPECTMQGGTTIVYNQQDTVLTATDVSSNYDTTNMNITYQFGYGSSATAALGNFTTGQTGNTYTVTKAMYRGTRYYGVKITVADKNDSSITATCTSGTGSNTGTNVANRTTMVIVNSRINFNPKTYNKNITGTLSGTSPLYVSYLGTDVYTGRTNATVGTIPTATPPTGYSAFDGWYTSGNAKVINADGTLTGVAVSGWTNASSQWVKTGTSTSSSSTANTLYAHYIPNAYTITLNKNGATNTPTASTTATYDATTLGAIATLPTKTGYTISGFTSPAGNNASGATVSSTTTMTATNTFNGWHQGSGTGTLIASNAATPALQASTDYTDSSKKWTYDGAVTLYAGWTTQSKTLPTITKTGHTCGWTETATGATTIQYESGSSLTPSANKTLYGVCIANSYNYTINYNTAEINDVSIYDDEDYVYEGITNGQVVSLTYGQYYGIDISAKGGYGISSIVSSPDTDSLSNISYSTNYVGADADIEVKPRNNTITISATPQTYIYLNKNGATNSPTISTRAIYNATALERINTLPTRSYTVSGFTLPASNNTSGAVVSSTSTLTVNYTFKGWYKEAAATNKIAGTTNTPALEASTTYTDANGKWTYTAANSVTLYAGWTASATILPTITKTGGFTCGWTTTPTNATSFEYASGGSLMPTANTTLYGVCKCPANKICYDANPVNWNGAIVSDEVTGTMGGQTISSSDTSATLMASNYSRVDENDWGYGFAGWSTKSLTPDTVENDKGAPILNIPSDTQVYGPNETISFAAGTYNSTGLTLYATWLYGDDVFHLDDWAEYNMCTRLNIGDVTAVTDYRDEAQVYAIAKLADGKCWMIENLRLDNTGRNNSTGTFAQGYASGFVGLANPETANFTNSTTANSLYSTSNITGSNQGYRFPRYNNNNTAARASNPTSNETALYSYGNYYTWPAAVADTGNYTTNNQTISSTSICPAGWHLPSGGDKNNFANNEFWKLSRAIVGADPANYNAGLTPYYTGATEGVNASNALRRFPNNFVYSGYYDINSASHYGLFGAYVSSTVTNSTQNYGLDLGADYLNPGDHKVGYKNSGFNVRCVFEPTYKIVYNGNGSDSGYSMQATNTNLREGHSVRLYASNFKRDGYGFAGWSTTQINPDAPNAATLMENAKIFGPQEGFTLSQDETAVASSDGTITMYAVWVKPTGNLQSWTGCSSLASGKVIALRDTRDNNAYAVAKLADGKCWMIENLRLDNTATNNTSGSGAQAYGGQFAGLANPESPWGQISTANSLYYSGTQSGTATINIGTTNPTYRFPRYNNSNTSTGGSGPSTKDDKGAVYLYGNYYTWPAAIANTTNYLTAGNYNTTSICPKGWRIPTGKGNGEFGILSNSLGGLKNSSNVAQPMNSSTTPTGATMVLRLLKFPNNFTLSGSINDAAYVNQGAWGSYWTSTVENVSAIDLFYIDGVTVYPGQGGFWGKWAAATVRCMIGS